MRPAGEVTRILEKASAGDSSAYNELLPLIYDELHSLAQRQMNSEMPGHTLQATIFAHDCYMKLVDQTRVNWKSKAHFFAIAAEVMRRLRVDYHRRKNREKRGGGRSKKEILEGDAISCSPSIDVLALDEQLIRLAEVEPLKAKIIELRFFGGLTMQEVAEVLEKPKRTVEREFEFAKAWLRVQLSK